MQVLQKVGLLCTQAENIRDSSADASSEMMLFNNLVDETHPLKLFLLGFCYVFFSLSFF